MTTAARAPEPAPAPGEPPAGSPLRGRISTAAPFLPAVPVVLAWVLWGHFDGGYFARTWYPCALGALVLLAALVVAKGRMLPTSPPVAVALGLFGALVAWTYLSLLWSTAPGDGLASANKLLLYLISAWILALLPWTTRAAGVMLGLWVAGTTGVCVISLLSAQGAEQVGDFFIDGRYLDPIGYANGVSALPAMALFPAFVLACSRSTPAPLRPLFLAASVLLLEFCLLPQSRGSLIGLIVAVPLFALLASERLRLILPALVVAGCAAVAFGSLYDVYDTATLATQDGAVNPPSVGPVLDSAVNMIWLTTLLAVAAGVLFVVLDRVVRPGPLAVQRTRRGVAAAMVLGAVVAAAVVLANAGTLRDEADEAWETFKSGKDTPAQQGARLTTAYADQRYDYWSVAVDIFEERPLVGIGAGGFESRYTRDRDAGKPSRYVHDFGLRVLSELGLIGFLLFLGFVVAGPGRAGWLRRNLSAAPAGLVAAMVCGSVYFFVHSSFDWIEEFPALASPAFALPLVALALAAPARVGRPSRRSGARSFAAGAAGLLALAAAGLALAPAYLASRYEDRATRIWTANPSAAFADLDRASDLSPLSPRPDLRAGTLAVDLGRLDEAKASFERSLEREDNWYAHFELALIASSEKRRREARRAIANALTLNDEDAFVSEAARRIRAGRRLNPAKFNNEIAELNRDRFTRPRN